MTQQAPAYAVNALWRAPAVENTGDSPSAPLVSPTRIWIGGDAPRPQTQLFRRVLHLSARPRRAWLGVFAESVYHLWVNGQYVARGPAYHHPWRRPVDAFELSELLQVGENVLAVLVHAPGIALHNAIPTGEPGLCARLVLEKEEGSTEVIDSDAAWRATDQSGWSAQTPRRNWALGYIESVDARVAPADWQAVGFEDGGWKTPDVFPSSRLPKMEYYPRPVPPLRYSFVPAPAPDAIYRLDAPPLPITAKDPGGMHGKALMSATWRPMEHTAVLRARTDGSLHLEGLSPQEGTVLCFDLGREWVGQVVFELSSFSGGRVDIGWSETIEDGRPQLVRKGVAYVDHLQARAGRNTWHPIGYNAMRYLALTLRGFQGDVTIRNLGVIASQPDLEWDKAFSTTDADAGAVAGLCEDSIRVGTQESVIDCPTREQAVYIGDGQLICRWIAMLTGDTRYWLNLIDDQFQRPGPQGLVRTAVHSGGDDTFIDYNLLAVTGLHDYWRYSRDRSTVERWIETCRGIVKFFDGLRDKNGLLDAHWAPPLNQRAWEMRYEPGFVDFCTWQQMNLFIDHPGMGWHNKEDAGIDRRGCNAALTALDIQARRALAEMEALVGESAAALRLREQADQAQQAVMSLCFDRERGVFIDGILHGKALEQVSEQTNTWAIAAGCCDDETARRVLTRLLSSDDPGIARNGPYFWAYLFPQLARLGLHELAMKKLGLWRPMLEAGATTLWETFAGDDLDSWCHPWSAAPLEFLLTQVAGLPGLGDEVDAPVLRPRVDLLKDCQARIFTRRGQCAISWTAENGRVQLHGELPDGVRGVLQVGSGERVSIQGNWAMQHRLR